MEEKDLIGSTWFMKNSCANIEDEVVTLSPDHELIDTGNPREVQFWQLKDHILILSFNNGYSTYRGVIKGDQYYGYAENILGEKWKFKAYLIGNKSFAGYKIRKS